MKDHVFDSRANRDIAELQYLCISQLITEGSCHSIYVDYPMPLSDPLSAHVINEKYSVYK